jgi:hypothetical protein
MIKVKISGDKSCVNLRRQTPNGSSIWGNCIFYFNEDIEECDYWVVYDSINTREKALCFTENTIFFTAEPPSIKKYSNFFLKQFHTVFTCHNEINHKNIIQSQPALPWFVGMKFNFKSKQWNHDNAKTWNDFEKDSVEVKSKLISIITSNKTFTSGHKNRINFLSQINKEFPNQIDIFGSGYREIEDKCDGLTKYKYSLVIENSSFQNYWTEKLADCFLTETYPIYYGCPNIFDYFPRGSLSIIDIDNIEESINIIKSVIESNEYENSLELIKKSKKLILNQYNFFPVIVNFINNLQKIEHGLGEKKTIKIFPEKRFQKKIKTFIRNLFVFFKRN